MALLVVDAIAWEGADASLYGLVKDCPEIDQLLLRAALRRIIEQPEQVNRFGKNRATALLTVDAYLTTLRKLRLLPDGGCTAGIR